MSYPPLEPGSVRIIAPPLPERRSPEKDQRAHWIAGNTVAHMSLPGLGEVAKVAEPYRCGCGMPRYSCVDSSGETLYRASRCDACAFVEAYCALDLMPIESAYQAAVAELTAFSTLYPTLARMFERSVQSLAPQAEPVAVALGRRLRPRSSALLPQHWEALMVRHARGDFGIYGLLPSAVVTPEVRFAPELAEPVAKNTLAIEAGSGIVRSRFKLPNEFLARTTIPEGQERSVVCDVATRIGPGEPVTACMLSSAGEQCFGMS